MGSEANLQAFAAFLLITFHLLAFASAQKTVSFSAGYGAPKKEFKLGALLGSGRVTKVYEIEGHPDRVIRLEAKPGLFEWAPKRFRDSFINQTIRNYQMLLDGGVPVAKVLDYQYDDYVVVEKISGIKLDSFIQNPFLFSSSERQEMENDLVDFARRTHKFVYIGDFKPDQLMYQKGRGWVLLDWSDGSRLAEPYNETNTFTDNFHFDLLMTNEKTEEHRLWYSRLFDKIRSEVLLTRRQANADFHKNNPTIALSGWGAGLSSKRYFQQLGRIGPGTKVTFAGNGFTFSKEYQVGERLGRGNTTVIYELLNEPKKALRVPIVYNNKKSQVRNGINLTPRPLRRSFINGTIWGHKILKEAGVKVVEMHDYRYDQFAIVDRVNGPSFFDFISNLESYSESEKEKMFKGFVEFAKSTYLLEEIGDFNSTQVVFDKERGWVLIDWTKYSRWLEPGNSNNTIGRLAEEEEVVRLEISKPELRPIIEKLIKESVQAIYELRKERPFSCKNRFHFF